MTEASDKAVQATHQTHLGRRVLITGAGRGIGQAIAIGLAARGASVAVADLRVEDIDETVKRIAKIGGPNALALQMDVSDYDAVQAQCEAAASAFGGAFDTVVNNAGISPKHDGKAHKVWEMSPDEWQKVVAVNLNGTFNTVRALSPAMCAAGKGWIVNMASVAGKTPNAVVGIHYSATKAAVIGFTKQCAFDLGQFGIRVNALAPGRIDSKMVREVAAGVNDDVIRMTPLGRLGQPEEVADVAAYLTSEQSSFVTGQTIDVAGGLGLS